MCNTINVYQSLDQKEKVSNYSSKPELVYSRVTTLSLIIRQLEKEGTGLIFCYNESLVKVKNDVSVKDNITVIDLQQLNTNNIGRKKILVVKLADTETIRISELHAIVKQLKHSGIALKWISILQQPVFNQLFKWELKYN